MTRISRIAAAAALVLGGTAFGQPMPMSPSTAPSFPNTPSFPNSSLGMSPLSPGGFQDQPAFPACDSSSGAADDGRVWADAEYLLGWVQGDPLPALVTSSPAGTARTSAGVLGTPGVSVLFGSGPTDTGVRQGARAEVGCWFDPDHQFGVECGLFALESDTQAFGAASNGAPILARPYFDVTAGAQASALVAFPGVSTGSVAVADSGRNFFGLNADFTANIIATPECRIDGLIGYQALRYDERLGVVQSVVPTSGPFAAGTSILSSDNFATMNLFNGLDLGVRTQFRYDAWSLELLGKVAAGPVQRTVSILGTQTVSVPGAAPVVSSGGLLALSSNIGSVTTHTLTAAPEFGVKLGWDVTPHIRVVTGYSVLWWLNVMRPGDVVDVGVNPGLIPPASPAAGSASRPAFIERASDVWAQTLSLGLEVKY